MADTSASSATAPPGAHHGSLVAAARAVDAARAASSQFELFGSFTLGSEEFALPAASIREVVNYPAKVIPVPLAPDYLDGVFTLRGTVIPILNLGRIFKPGAAPSSASQKVIIIDHEFILVGLLVDTLGEVLRVRPEQRSVLQYQEGAGPAVIAGAILLGDGERLLQVLDATALVRIENVPQVRALQASTRADRNRFLVEAGRRKCIRFTVGGVAFAFGMEAIREIIAVPEMKPSVMGGSLCVGRINFRGHPVAVVDFAALMKFGTRAGAEQERRRILVAPLGGNLIGFLVDSVDSIFSYLEAELMAVPLLSRARLGMIAGCVSREADGDILCLDQEGVLSHAELVELSEGHVNLYQQEAHNESADTRKSAGRRVAHVAFSLDVPWAVELRQLREIIAYRAGMLRPPGLPAWVHGVLHVRQQVITVIDLRSLFGLPSVEPGAATRILVVEDGQDRYGLMVDSVDTIIQVSAHEKRSAPRMLRGASAQPELIELAGADGKANTLNVLEVPYLLALMGSASAA